MPDPTDRPDNTATDPDAETRDTDLCEPRRWRADGWTAQVIKNEDDDGWAVSMTRHGEAEPALVGPWTMGRDKKNPKSLDAPAFATLVKTASEVLRRHEQQLQAQLHKRISVTSGSARIDVSLDIAPDDEHPSARLSAFDAVGNLLAEASVSPAFRLTSASASAWIDSGYRRPG